MTQRHDSALGLFVLLGFFFVFFFDLLKLVYSFIYTCIRHWNRLKKRKRKKKPTKNKYITQYFAKELYKRDRKKKMITNSTAHKMKKQIG